MTYYFLKLKLSLEVSINFAAFKLWILYLWILRASLQWWPRVPIFLAVTMTVNHVIHAASY